MPVGHWAQQLLALGHIAHTIIVGDGTPKWMLTKLAVALGVRQGRWSRVGDEVRPYRNAAKVLETCGLPIPPRVAHRKVAVVELPNRLAASELVVVVHGD